MRRPRRHPAQVTSDRLAEAVDRWADRLDGATLDEIAHVRYELERITTEDETGRVIDE